MASRHQRYDTTNRKKDEPEELLVFGYSCRLFRDDEKALYIDQGKHLIPWMGDDTLKIDRYDVRGTVADLKPLEPLPGGASEAQWSSLSDSERKAEQLCDEERYRALYHNEAEEALYQEEEIKRLHQALDSQHSYGQVAYNYDDANNSEQQPEDQGGSSSADAEEEDLPFVAPPELDIPIGMVLPEKCKLNAIIVKTALFISNQGPQMEIILKTKQANNPQFEFLSFDCPLHAYYRHLLMAIKTGRYRPQEQQNQQDQQESDADDHYLHPSLAPPPARVELAPSIPSINYKPSADCAYSLLVSKIKDKQLKNAETSSDPSSPQPSAAFASSSRRRKAAHKSSGSSSQSNSRSGSSDSCSDSSSDSENSSATSSQPTVVMPPHEIQLIIDKMASYVIKNGRDFEAVVRSKGDARFGFLDATHEYHPYYEHKMRVYQGLEPASNSGPSACQDRPKKKKKKKEKPKLLLFPQYQSSSSDSESDSPRKDNAKRKASKVQTPVCFSIKKPKEAEILQEIRSALPLDLEESSEEDEENKDKKDDKKDKESSDSKASNKDDKDRRRSKTEAPEEAITEKDREEELKKTQTLLKEKERELREKEAAKKRSEDIFEIPEPEKKEKPKQLSDELVDLMNSTKEEEKSIEIEDDDDLITEAEIIDLTDDKVVIPKAKESELKLERKRRAAAFLNRIRSDRQAPSNGTTKASLQVESMSVPSPPSPPRLTEVNGSVIPKHSLLARLAASNVVSKQPSSISIERKHKHKKSEAPRKRSRSRSSSSGRQSKRDKKHKKKRHYDSPEHDRSRPTSRSRSRSVLSPVKGYNRRKREHPQEHRFNTYYDVDRDDGSYARHKSFKHKSHKHSKHRRDHHSVENDGDEETSGSHKHKHNPKPHSKNEPSSDSSEE